MNVPNMIKPYFDILAKPTIIEQLGYPGWDPICFINTNEGFQYYLPALARLCLKTGEEYYLDEGVWGSYSAASIPYGLGVGTWTPLSQYEVLDVLDIDSLPSW